MDIEKILKDTLAEIKGAPVEVTEATTFDSLGLDSLDKVSALMQIEDELGIDFGDNPAFTTVGELLAKIKELKK